MKIYGLTYYDNGKVYNFKADFELSKNDLVVVETDKGLQAAKVNYVKDPKDSESIREIKPILRKFTQDDEKKYFSNLKDAKEVFEKAKELVKKLELDMRVLSAAYTLDKEALIINFVSDDRVDFRELAKKLASIYKTRIELRQVGVRDKAKEIGGIGPCGRFLCCNSFLTDLNSVTINMAKNQVLALNPTKINGVCGRLLCCLGYEDDVYTELKKGMPSMGSIYHNGDIEGKVVSLNLLKRTITIETKSKTLIEVDV